MTNLCFTFGAGPCLPFHPSGRLFFNDWRFDIFSPDGAFVLLLQDRFGPYHVVAIGHLNAYLTGEPPDEVIADRPSAPGGFVPVHARARWLASRTFEFYAEGEQTRRILHVVER